MIAVISPAKTLDFSEWHHDKYTLPRLGKASQQLIKVLKKKSPEEIRDLMGISDSLAALNVDRYQNFSSRHTTKNARPCSFAFKGDVYVGLEAKHMSSEELDFAQSHLRILSGLYGLLRPMDLIQPYRLEMGTKLAFDDYTTLYDFWQDKMLKLLKKDLKQQGDSILINLASQEYFKAIAGKSLNVNVIDIEFKDFNHDQYKIVSFYAKKARGMMSRFMIKNRINNVADLKGFDYEGYYYDDRASSEKKLAFKRDAK